jgi:RimJ/RimL family protein N-acetyltransferase
MPVGRIQTSRLELRDWTAADGGAFHRIWGDPDVIWWGHTTTPEDSQRFLDTVIERGREPGLGWCAVLLPGTQASIGSVGLQHAPEPRDDIEIGWHLERTAWGNGYATEAAAALLDHAFERGLERVVADIVPGNERSVSVATRLSMHRVAEVQRSGLTHDLWAIEVERWQGQQ